MPHLKVSSDVSSNVTEFALECLRTGLSTGLGSTNSLSTPVLKSNVDLDFACELLDLNKLIRFRVFCSFFSLASPTTSSAGNRLCLDFVGDAFLDCEF